MDYEKLISLLAHSPAVKLLRAKNAPLILSFLYREFKENNRLTISSYELVNRLADYLEALDYADETDPFEDILVRAKRYIDDWCSEQNRYLRKFPDETGEPVHELTADTEKAFQWIDSLEKKAFVGTESRFLDIFAKLTELVEKSSEDPEKRIADLEHRKRAIEAEIRQIRASGTVASFSNTQIKERFYEIGKLGRELLSDFKEVEQNFKAITRSIYEKQAREKMRKGAILGYTLDATDELRDSDQGRSFHAFWRFLMADNRQDELTALVDKIFDLLENRQIDEADPFLARIKVNLHRAGQKVVASNHRLAEKLSRILAEKHMLERRKTIELVGDIKRLALDRLADPPKRDPFIAIEGDPDVRMVMDRPLGTPPQTADFANQPGALGASDIGAVDFGRLFNQFEIDREALQVQIDDCLRDRDQVTLAEIVQKYPIARGVAELVTYLAIATASPAHLINDQTRVEIQWQENDMRRTVRLPQVIYGR